MRQLRLVFTAFMTLGLFTFAAIGPLTAQDLIESETAEPIGFVAASEGVLTVTRSDGTELQVGVGDKIYQYDIVQTDSASSAKIVFIDQSTLIISPQVKLIIDEYVFNSRLEAGEIVLTLSKCVLRFVDGRIVPSVTKNNALIVSLIDRRVEVRLSMAIIPTRE